MGGLAGKRRTCVPGNGVMGGAALKSNQADGAASLNVKQGSPEKLVGIGTTAVNVDPGMPAGESQQVELKQSSAVRYICQ